MASNEQIELKALLKDLLDKGFIRLSNFLCVFPVWFVKKKDDSFRMCINYREINKINIKIHYPVPWINDLFYKLQGASYFSKIHMRSGYHKPSVTGEDIPKTTFHPIYDLYDFSIMFFGITNTLATFMYLLN